MWAWVWMHACASVENALMCALVFVFWSDACCYVDVSMCVSSCVVVVVVCLCMYVSVCGTGEIGGCG